MSARQFVCLWLVVKMKSKKSVNKLLYCLLIILFGSVGVHKFYAKKYVSGILYLGFVWTGIPEILTIIDLIWAVTRKADSEGNILI